MRKKYVKQKRYYSLRGILGMAALSLFLFGACAAQDSEEMWNEDDAQSVNYIEKYYDERLEAHEAMMEAARSSSDNKNVDKPTATPKPTEKVEEKPDTADMYVAAMEHIDEAIGKARVSKEYSGYSYRIKDKKIKEGNNGLGVVYNVSFIIEFNGVLQKYRVDIQLSPMKDYLMGGYTYYVTDSNVYHSGSTFLDY